MSEQQYLDVEDAAKMQYDPCMGFLCLNRVDATPHELLLADEAINHYARILQLVNAVDCEVGPEYYDRITCRDIYGVNWFEARDALTKKGGGR